MARGRSAQPLRASVLDRLMTPESSAERATKGRGQVLRELKESVRRDLEDLLNTRWRCSAWPPNLDELDVSLVNYGLPDFTGANLGAPDNQEEFRRIIQRVIENYEPRFKKIDVQLIGSADPMDRVLRFRVEAMLHVEPAPEPIVFDTSLEPLTANFEVRGGGR